MPTTLTDENLLTATCETCGEPAYFGRSVQFGLALNAYAAGKFELAKWCCGKHVNNIKDKAVELLAGE
jgi:hypothetical protein